MVARIKARLSYGNVVATLALFIALGGTSYAALKLPRNSVGSAQIRANAVTSAKVKDGSLLLRDFRRSQRALLRGSAGPQGAQGLQGLQGPAGAKGDSGATNVVVRSADLGPIPPGVFTGINAACQPGEIVVGGGASSSNLPHTTVEASFPSRSRTGLAPAQDGQAAVGWAVELLNTSTTEETATAYVMCVRP